MAIRNTTEIAETYMIRLCNDGMTSVKPSEITAYLKSIGIDGEETIKVMIKNKILLELKSGKVTLNMVKIRKKRKK